MPDNFVLNDVCKERRTAVDERFRRDKADIEGLQDKTEKHDELLQKLSETNIKMGSILENYNKQIADHEDRLSKIEERPAKWWEYFVGAVIGGGGAAVVGWIVGTIQSIPH